MTREEAIEYAESKKMRLEALVYNDDCKYGNYAMYSGELSFVNAALTALRPVSREQVEKVWRGCEWCNGEHSNNGEISAYAEVECEGCDAGDNCPNAHSSDDPCYGMVDRALSVNFCPVCGRPLTDEAVEMVMERMEALHGE